MRYYRATFPDATVTVKLHLLEDHVVSFIGRWNGVGFGLLGEQGSESIHADFNNSKRRYAPMPNPVERLKCIMKDHLLRCAPANITAKPMPKMKMSLKDTPST